MTTPTTTPTTAAATQGARVWRFFQKRHPILPNLAGTLTLVVAVSFAAQAVQGASVLLLGARELAAVLLAFGSSLLMRGYDELKDVETDRRLAASGDALFAKRPIVTGEIHADDLLLVKNLALAIFCAGALAGVGLSQWPLLAATAAGFLFVIIWLSSRWFFWPRIQTDLLLAFVTHNPVAGFLGLALLAVVARAPLEGVVAAALVGASWFPISAWEIARKLRAPADETAYETYSKRLGRGVAVALPVGFVLITLACLWMLARRAQAPNWYLGGALGFGAVFVGALLRYGLKPTTSSARLQPVAELFMVAATAGLPLALLLVHGVRLSF